MSTRDKLIAYFIRRWGHLGKAAVPGGGLHVGPRPDITKFSYLLAIMPPLSKEQISTIERGMAAEIPDRYRSNIHSDLPNDLKNFYATANGFSAFVRRFGLMGSATTGPPLMRPPDIIGLNIEAAIRSTEEPDHENERGLLAIARYDDDAKAFISESGDCRAISHDGKQLATWPNLEAWMLGEIERIGSYYDHSGKSIYDSLDHEIPSPK